MDNIIKRGEIHVEDAYAQAKMLDNSGWQDREKYGHLVLPRFITPSDIDFVVSNGNVIQIPFYLDDNGKIIYCELMRSHTSIEWKDLRRGQKLGYHNMIVSSPHCAVLCRHEVSPEMGRKIDTRKDILEFQVVVYDFGFITTKVYKGNDQWQRFVLKWFSPQGAIELRRYILGRNIGMHFPPKASKSEKTA
jgi:hypothetical protein